MNRRTAVVAVLLAVVLAGGIYFMQKKRAVSSTPVAALPAPVQSEEKTKGPANAPVQIAEYSDFQCPGCMRAQSVINDIMKEYPGKIRLTFYHYPLPMHQWAGLAHQAAECANVQGKFWEFHDLVYQNQAGWSAAVNVPEIFISYAKTAGLNLDTFGACLSNGEITSKIMRERASGTLLRLASTPTFFINGERVVGQVELETTGRNIIRKILGLAPLEIQKPASVSSPVMPKAQIPAAVPAPATVPPQENSSAASAQN